MQRAIIFYTLANLLSGPLGKQAEAEAALNEWM